MGPPPSTAGPVCQRRGLHGLVAPDPCSGPETLAGLVRCGPVGLFDRPALPHRRRADSWCVAIGMTVATPTWHSDFACVMVYILSHYERKPQAGAIRSPPPKAPATHHPGCQNARHASARAPCAALHPQRSCTARQTTSRPPPVVVWFANKTNSRKPQVKRRKPQVKRRKPGFFFLNFFSHQSALENALSPTSILTAVAAPTPPSTRQTGNYSS